jgi:hypothetical protein
MLPGNSSGFTSARTMERLARKLGIQDQCVGLSSEEGQPLEIPESYRRRRTEISLSSFRIVLEKLITTRVERT